MQRHVMLWIRVLLLTLFSAGLANASVTAAWKMPVDRVAPSYADSPALEKAPADSAFFQPGDKLWDLSKHVDWSIPDGTSKEAQEDPFAPQAGKAGGDWKGDWVVWNSRPGMIVARGSWRDVLVADRALGFDELPAVIRTRVEVKGAGKTRSLSLISRSDEKASMQVGDLRAEVEAVIAFTPAVTLEVPFRLSWSADDNRGTWEVNTAIPMREGRPYRIARHGMGDRGWEVTVSAEREDAEGTPWKELRQVEADRGVQLWPGASGEDQVRKKLDENRWLGVYPLTSGFVYSLLVRENFPLGPEMAPPPELAEWKPSMLIDLRPWLQDRGVDLSIKGSMAVLDPVTPRVFIITDKLNQELSESLFQSCCGDAGSPIWIESNPESGNWGVASRSGEKAEIRRASSDPGNLLHFLTEPTQGGNGDLFDLRYTIDVVSGDAKIGRLESATTLNKDKPQVIGSGVTPDGKEVKVTMAVSQPRQ